jgi:hypothetical protein
MSAEQAAKIRRLTRQEHLIWVADLGFCCWPRLGAAPQTMVRDRDAQIRDVPLGDNADS